MGRVFGRLLSIFQFHRLLGRWVIAYSTLEARLRLRKTGPISILIDSSVLAAGVTHETAWISTGTTKWGNQEIETGYAARIPVFSTSSQERYHDEIRYLPGIAYLASKGYLKLLSYSELEAERFYQPVGRFSGYGYFDYSIFAEVPIEVLGDRQFDMGNAREKLKKRVLREKSELFLALLNVLGTKSSLDAHHIFFSEKEGIFAFLHIDFPLAQKIRQNARAEPISKLRTKVLLPSQLAALFSLKPIPPHLLSYEGASFRVHPELHWKEEKRRGGDAKLRR